MTTGAGQARAGTVTVLFTDLVESTAMRQSLGDDRADDVRRDHDRIVRGACEQHGGTEVKALGDGFMLVFGAAGAAVSAAVELQRTISRLAQRGRVPVSVRIGASAGDVLWEGDDCFGTPVVEAARLCDAAASGQILVSDVVRILAGSRGGHRFASAGSLELKGLQEPVVASEVEWEVPVEDGEGLPAALRTSSAPFVGRVTEREQLERLWKDAATGSRRVALVGGEPGVGKTRIATELARTAHDEGATVLFGRCDEDLGVPFQPFVEALTPLVATLPTEELASRVGPSGGELARLVPELATRLPELPEPIQADAETERWRLFAAVTAFLEATAAAGPVVLFVDDLHWAAKPTLLLLRHLVRCDFTGPFLIAGTYRDTDLGRTHPLAEMLADLRREDDVTRISLHGLDPAEVVEFVTRAAGHELDEDGADLARRLYDETEGNPFFMGQVLRHLVESGTIVEVDGRWQRREGTIDLGIPEGVREVVGRRLARLAPDTNEILASAAVIGRDFDRALLTTVADADSEAVLDALEEAEAARLVAGTPRGCYEFVHALVRSTLYDEIPTTRRLRLHRRVGEALEAGDVDAHLEQLAHHFAEAAALGETAKAVGYGRRAAASARERAAYEESALDYERALGVLDPDDPADGTARAELLVELGRVVWALGERNRAREILQRAAVVARDIGRYDLLAEATIVRGGGSRGWAEAGSVDVDLVQQLEECVAHLPATDESRRARVLGRLAMELNFLPAEAERCVQLYREALAIARRIDDPEALALVLCAGFWVVSDVVDYEEKLDEAYEAALLAADIGDRVLEFTARSYLVAVLQILGRIPEAKTEFALLKRISDDLHQPEVRWAALVHEAAFAIFEGRFEEGDRLANEALEVGQRAEIASAVQMYGVTSIAMQRVFGGLEDAVPLIEALVEEWPLVPAWRTGLAYVYRELERPEDARLHLEHFKGDWDARLPKDGNHLVGAALLAAAARSLDDADAAAQLYAYLAAHADCVIVAGLPADILGSTHHFLMMLAGTMERWDDFEMHGREALARNEAFGSPSWLAQTRYEMASLLLDRARDGDRARARELTDGVLALAREYGMGSLEAKADALSARLDA